MTIHVRDIRPDDASDAEAVVRVLRAALPFLVTTPAGVAHELASAHPAKHHRILLAETPDGDKQGKLEENDRLYALSALRGESQSKKTFEL
ncbi:hypothetical protein AB0E73_25790, partial [Streptomyces sp. NPDC031705]